MNKIVINFTTCSPPPVGGYKIFYRVSGSEDAYILAGTFSTSPAIFYDDVNPAGTCYEGYIVSVCSEDVMGNHIGFETCGSDGDFDNSSCGTTIGFVTEDPAYVNLGNFDLHVDGAVSVELRWQSIDRPNRFNLYEDAILIQTTGWKGYAPYIGPWGGSLSTVESGVMTFTPLPGKDYYLNIEAGPAGPPPYDLDDYFLVDIVCL